MITHTVPVSIAESRSEVRISTVGDTITVCVAQQMSARALVMAIAIASIIPGIV